MGPKRLKETLRRLIVAARDALTRGTGEGFRPPMVWGPPGIGKSAVLRQLATSLGWGFTDVRAVMLDPVDVRGIPAVDRVTNRVAWATPQFWPSEEDVAGAPGWLLFLDEIPQAPPLVQSALLQLTLDRAIGEYVLPAKVVVVAAGNRGSDRAGANRIITPLLGRLQHYELEASFTDWMEWSLSANIAPEVRAYMASTSGERLFHFDPSKNDLRAWPNPRAWEAVSFNLRAMDYDENTNETSSLFDAVAACVGEGDAAKFVAHLKYHTMLPDLEALWKNPKAAPIPKEPAVLWALAATLAAKCSTLLAELGKGAKDTARCDACIPAVEYVSRDEYPDEFCVAALREIAMLVPTIMTKKEFDVKFRKLVRDNILTGGK